MGAIAGLLNLVPSWVYAIVIAALLALGAGQAVHIAALKGSVATERAAHEKTKAEYTAKALAAEHDAREREQDLRSYVEKLKEQKDAQIDSLSADVRDLRKRLSYLPARPAGDPGAENAGFGQAPSGCPGPILYRDTAEALADEAERADVIRFSLKACYAAWDHAKELMDAK